MIEDGLIQHAALCEWMASALNSVDSNLPETKRIVLSAFYSCFVPEATSKPNEPVKAFIIPQNFSLLEFKTALSLSKDDNILKTSCFFSFLFKFLYSRFRTSQGIEEFLSFGVTKSKHSL
jgi:hypothetical protein